MSNPLADVLPAQARKIVYAIAFLALLVYTAFMGAEGNWLEAVGTLLASLVPLLAASNVSPEA